MIQFGQWTIDNAVLFYDTTFTFLFFFLVLLTKNIYKKIINY